MTESVTQRPNLVKAHQQHLSISEILHSTSGLTSFWNISVNHQPGYSEAQKARCQKKSRSRKPAPFLLRNLALGVRPDELLDSFSNHPPGRPEGLKASCQSKKGCREGQDDLSNSTRIKTSVQIRLVSWPVRQLYVQVSIKNNRSFTCQDKTERNPEMNKPPSSQLLPVETLGRRPAAFPAPFRTALQA